MGKVLQYRTIPRVVFTRADDDESVGTATGLSPVYNTLSVDLGGWREIIAVGAAKRSLEENDILGLGHHDYRQIFGRTSEDTMSLKNTDDGVSYSMDLPDTTAGRDMATLLDRRDVKGASFGFYPVMWAWERREDEDGEPMAVEIMLEIDLLEISLVASPAYLESTAKLASLRAVGEQLGEPPGDLVALTGPQIRSRLLASLDRSPVTSPLSPQPPSGSTTRKARLQIAQADLKIRNRRRIK